MFNKFSWAFSQVFGGLSLPYLRKESGRLMTSAQIWLIFLIVVPCLTACYNIMVRSGAERAFCWLFQPKNLSERDRSHLFVAAFVTFLFINGGLILLFSLVVHGSSWFFFFTLQSLFFLLLLFNINYMRTWLGEENGQRPDKQHHTNKDRANYRPILYYLHTILFLLYGELKKLFFGVSWFLIIMLLYVLPIYLRT